MKPHFRFEYQPPPPPLPPGADDAAVEAWVNSAIDGSVKAMTSISTAAKMAGVSRMTIHRAINSGLLTLRGKERGRDAKGIEVRQLIDVFIHPDGAGFKMKNRAPSLGRVLQNIEEAGGDWRRVFGALTDLIAAGDNSDLDLVAAVFGCLHQIPVFEDVLPPPMLADFISVLEKRSNRRDLKQKNLSVRFGLRLGRAVLGIVGDFQPIPESVSAAVSWGGMQRLLRKYPPPVRSVPQFVRAIGKDGSVRFDLVMAPRWDAGSLPMEYRETPKFARISAGPTAAAILRVGSWKKVKQALDWKKVKLDWKEVKQALDAITAIIPRHPSWDSFLRDVWRPILPYLTGEDIFDEKMTDERFLAQSIAAVRQVAESAGLSPDYVEILRDAYGRLRKNARSSSLVPDKATKSRGETKTATIDHVHFRRISLSDSAVARVMGLTRRTILLQKAKRASIAAAPAPAPIVALLRCPGCGEPVGVKDEVCAACGRML